MCTKPLKGFQIGVHSSGKPNYYITSYSADHVEIRPDGKVVACYTPEISPYSKKVVKVYRDIPCGRCVECRLSYARQWADRCLLELEDHEEAWFLTLTYDNEHLPLVESVDPESGEYHVLSTLRKEDLQKFFKRLRKDGQKIRYFACGEYGSETLRAHYHAIVYSLHIPDLVPYSKNFQGDVLYTSEYLNRMWHNQGYVIVGNVTWESCAYVSRYVMKKQYGKNAPYDKLGILPEYTVMSRRPGIGRNYYEQHKDEIYENEHFYISTKTGGKTLKPGRYFDRLYEEEHPEKFAEIRQKRQTAYEERKKIMETLTDKDFFGMMQVRDELMQSRSKKLLRKDI